ncbi:MAG TPA: hypothetical protein VE967_05050 [Gemmatimonadaceae bacterium]|nr:hypothetical protein [Gemmatimonadaceae bacterium]
MRLLFVTLTEPERSHRYEAMDATPVPPARTPILDLTVVDIRRELNANPARRTAWGKPYGDHSDDMAAHYVISADAEARLNGAEIKLLQFMLEKEFPDDPHLPQITARAVAVYCASRLHRTPEFKHDPVLVELASRVMRWWTD